MIKFDCYDLKYKNPRGAMREGTPTRFRVDIKKTLEIDHVNLIIRGEGNFKADLYNIGTDGEYDIFQGDGIIEKTGLYFYRFELIRSDGTMIFAGTRDGHTAVCGDWLPEWRVAAYSKDFTVPEGFDGAVMYQIFPDRFYKAEDVDISGTHNDRIIHENWNERPYCYFDYEGYKCNDYFMGNLRGIEQKLDYIKSLGVTHIYLNPIFESAENHRYATSDYLRIDPYLGTNEDFTSLCESAKSKGIKIILDGVFSHTGDDSKYFNRYGHFSEVGAYNDCSSPYYDWYCFEHYPDDYQCWWGFKTLPNVCETNPKYMEFITGENGVLRYWMRLGASGWRLDVADELPDVFLEAVRKAVKAEDQNAVIIGEVWENAVTKHSYGAQRRFLLGKQCDTVMNYPFLNAITDFAINTDADAFYNLVMKILNDYPAPSVSCLMNMLSTHDTVRILNRLGIREIPERKLQKDAKMTPEQRELGLSRLMIAVILQFTLPGVPCIYYGDEVGLEGFGDPFCRATFPWGCENEKLLNLHRTLGIIRNEHKNDFTAPIEFIRHDSGILSYTRGDMLITVNCSKSSIDIGERDVIAGFNFDGSTLFTGGAVIQRKE